MKQSLEQHANILVEQAVADSHTSSLKLPAISIPSKS